MARSKLSKAIAIFGSGLAVGYCLYSAYKYWKKKQSKSIDEGFEDVSRLEENPVKRILVLGTQNAGKSAILSQLTSDVLEQNKTLSPTEGFNVTTLEHNGVTLNIWEVGGSEKVRAHWGNFLQDTDVLVFVVDSADLHNLSLAVTLVKELLADQRLVNVPVLLLANKQDLPGALKPNKVAEALELRTPHVKHTVSVIGTQVPPGAAKRHSSIVEAERTLLRLVD